MTAKERVLVESICFSVLRQMRLNDSMIQVGENERGTDAAIRVTGTISRMVEDLRTFTQLRQAQERSERRVTITHDPPDQDEPAGNELRIHVKGVAPTSAPDVPAGSYEADVAAATRRVAPSEPVPAKLSDDEVWAALVADDPDATGVGSGVGVQVPRRPVPPPVAPQPSSGGAGGFDAFNASMCGDHPLAPRAPLGRPLRPGERRVLTGERRGVQHFGPNDRTNTWVPKNAP